VLLSWISSFWIGSRPGVLVFCTVLTSGMGSASEVVGLISLMISASIASTEANGIASDMRGELRSIHQ